MTNENTNLVFPSNQKVKIKEEKRDPEIEDKIRLLEIKSNLNNLDKLYNHKAATATAEEDVRNSKDLQTFSHAGDEQDDDKKNVQLQVKSSNEILTELFKVFNATPPEEILDDKTLIHRAKKHRKSKKRKYKRDKSDTDECSESSLEQEDYRNSYRYKKRKKSKHKDKHESKENDKTRERNRDRDRDRSRDKSKYDSMHKKTRKSNERERTHDDEKRNSPNRQKHHDRYHSSEDTKRRRNDFYNGYDDFYQKTNHNTFKTRVKEEFAKTDNVTEKLSLNPSKSNESDISDISLSDEEIYMREKQHGMAYRSPRNRNGKAEDSYIDPIYSYKKDNKTRERDRSREHKRDYNNYSHRRHGDRHYRSHSRSRSKSRSRSRSRVLNLDIDKKRLLEIARKNAIHMFKNGNLPGSDRMSQEIKDRVLLKMRYGGRTVEDLTKFCQKISKGEHLSDISSDEDSDMDKSGNAKAFHHPFQLKEREPIVMHIRNSKPIVPAIAKTAEQTKAITMQFPVSSGQQHRLTESWVPVETNNNMHLLPPSTAAVAHKSSNLFKNVAPKNILGKSLPTQAEQEPAFKPTAAQPPPQTAGAIAPIEVAAQPVTEETRDVTQVHSEMARPPKAFVPQNIMQTTEHFVPDVSIPSTSNAVLNPSIENPMDVSTIISRRLNAMRRLQENPTDEDAVKMLYSTQKDMSNWAASKYLPGQFTGSTGANILKPSELNSGPQIWARRDQLTSAKPMTGGMGMQLLQKMGWKPGEGLGRDKNGALQPLLLDIKLDKRGLITQGDVNVHGKKAYFPKKRSSDAVDIQNKHPVCLLNELTSKRKWTPPLYTVINDNGPSHNRMFLISVFVNGENFTPSRASNTKKEAKLLAAKHCLQQIGILPAD